MFAEVLYYLRTGKLNQSSFIAQANEIKTEFEFFKIKYV